jgi:hypothetical protein
MCPSLYPLAFICLNSSFSNKAVSDGALSFYHDHFVRTRISKFTYGEFCAICFDPADPDHQQRLRDTYTDVSGVRRISHSFNVILPKVFNFSSSFLAVEMCLRRIRKFRKLKSSKAPFTVNAPRRSTSSKALLVLCGAIVVRSPCRGGKMSIQVCLWLLNYEIYLNRKCRQLYKALHD